MTTFLRAFAKINSILLSCVRRLFTFKGQIRKRNILTLLLHFCHFTFNSDLVHVCKTEMKSNINKAFLCPEVQRVHAFVPLGPCDHV